MRTVNKVKYGRILLKLSGEVLGNRATGECIDPKNLAFMAERVKKIHKMGVQVGIVLGGGNIFRGLTGADKGVNRVTGDSMGMLATIINGLAMMNALESIAGRASGVGARALLKATKVDGIYPADPKKDPKAKKYAALKYETALEKRLKVMDSAAFALCMDNGIPIVVFDFFDGNALERVVKGEAVGTIVSDK